MRIFMYLYVTLVSTIWVGGQPAGPAEGGSLASPPAVVASLEASCTEEVPAPTITAEVANHSAQAVAAQVHRDGTEVAHLHVPAGQTESVSLVDAAWEDHDHLFEVRDDGVVLASLEHGFDCIHPVLDVDITEDCSAWSAAVTVSNSGHEGTQVTVSLDGAIVAEPPVAPGQSVLTYVAIGAGELLEVAHHGELVASAVTGCPGEAPGEDDPSEPEGPTMSEDDPDGPTLEEVPGDGRGVGSVRPEPDPVLRSAARR